MSNPSNGLLRISTSPKKRLLGLSRLSTNGESNTLAKHQRPRASNKGMGKEMTIREVVQDHVERTIEKHRGDFKAAAKELGVCLKTVYNLTNKYAAERRNAQEHARLRLRQQV